MLLAWRNLPDVTEYMFTDDPIAPQEHAIWFERLLADPHRRPWIITHDGNDVGLVVIYDIDRRHRRCHWGFYIAPSGSRRQGIFSAAAFAVLDHVFDKMGLNKVCGEVLATNRAAIAAHEALGFGRDGVLREHLIKHRVAMDVIALSLLKRDWDHWKTALADKLRERGHLQCR